MIALAVLGCSGGERETAPPAVSRQEAQETPVAGALATPTLAPQPTPTAFSQVAPAVQPPDATPLDPPPPPPTATPVRGGTDLPLPAGTTVAWGGCASGGRCYSFNFYWAPTHEAVLQNGEPEIKVQHELCHAHQHWSINGGAPLSALDYDLEPWYGTGEGQSYVSAVSGLPWPWSHSAVSGLEDFAWTCAYWYLDPAHLLQVSPQRYDWAASHLP
ncbi:MAG: hypothetical protein WEE64_02305 [Dehalococcoidia bacterium]